MRDKKRRFKEIAERFNVVCPEKPIYENIKGRWRDYQFKNQNDIVVELACGRGEYTVGLAEVFPQRNFIGVDLKGDRIWVGSNEAMKKELPNAAFLRTNIIFLEKFFQPGEVNEIWITFPDPRPKLRDEKHRLTNNSFLDLYKGIIAHDGTVHFKTDNTELFEYTREVLSERNDIMDLVVTNDLYQSSFNDLHHGIKTKYEKKFYDLGEKIKYLSFRFA